MIKVGDTVFVKSWEEILKLPLKKRREDSVELLDGLCVWKKSMIEDNQGKPLTVSSVRGKGSRISLIGVDWTWTEDLLFPSQPVQGEQDRLVKTADIHARVRRGRDWSWGNQDCDKEGTQVFGTILERATTGWVRVLWDRRDIFIRAYRIGAEDKYDLYYVDSLSALRDKSEDCEEKRTTPSEATKEVFRRALATEIDFRIDFSKTIEEAPSEKELLWRSLLDL